MKEDDTIIVFSGANDFPLWINNFSGPKFIQELRYVFAINTPLAKNLVCNLLFEL
jgi:hypothetical protein